MSPSLLHALTIGGYRHRLVSAAFQKRTSVLFTSKWGYPTFAVGGAYLVVRWRFSPK